MQSAIFESANKFISKVAAANNLFLAPTKKGFQLVSTNKGNVAQFVVSGETIEGLDTPVEIVTASMMAALKNRKEVNLKYKGGALVVTSGKYSAEIMTIQAPELPALGEAEGDAVKLDEDTWKWVAQAVNSLRIEKTSSIVEDDVSFMLRITDKGAFAASFELGHMAFTFNKKLKGDLQLILPFSTATLLVKELPAIGADINISQASVFFRTKQFRAQIALMADIADNKAGPDQVYETCVAVPKEDGVEITLDKEAFVTFLENAQSVYVPGASVQVEAGSSGATLVLSTTNGKVTATVKGKAADKIRFGLDLRFLKEVVAKAEDELVFSVVPERFVVLKGKGLYYVAGLSQDAAKK